MLDLAAAIAHHLLAFGILGVLVAEWTLLAGGVDDAKLSGAKLRRLAGIDSIYGLLALGLIAIGIVRVAFGARGAEFYLPNPVFWTKMAAFAAVGLLSALPTIRLARWARQIRHDHGFMPPPAELARVRSLVAAELLVFPVILVAAAALGRGYGA